MPRSRVLHLTHFELACIDKAIAYIAIHFKDKISVDQLSELINLSKEKIQFGFQQKTSLTLHRYLLQERIKQAKILLIDTNEPVKNIAFVTGFKNESHFSRVFRQENFISPSKYRRLQLQV